MIRLLKYNVPLWLSLLMLTVAYGVQKKPEISVSPARAKSGEHVMLTGVGFTPDRTIISHMKRPDESEYNPLRLRSNERGEFTHKIDTVMLDIGQFEVWVEDETAKVVSNRVRFVVVE
jgi:hypothetical protein